MLNPTSPHFHARANFWAVGVTRARPREGEKYFTVNYNSP